MSKQNLAIEIDTPKTFEMVCMLDPTYRELKYDDVHNAFLVLAFPIIGTHSIIQPERLREAFDHLESGLRMKTWTFFTK
jgi:hypothetical protein